MSAPAIKTWVTGELVSAADFNGQIKDQLANSFLHKATEPGSIPYLSALREEAALAPPSDSKRHFLIREGDGAAPQWLPTSLPHTELGTYTANGDTDLTTWSNYSWLYVYDNRSRSGNWILTSKITDDVNTSTRVVYTDLSSLYHYITLYQNEDVLAIYARRLAVSIRTNYGGSSDVVVAPEDRHGRRTVDSSVDITIFGLQ
ncbi:MAG: hypothetical protein OXG39_15805 [Chloroflexi bacterium]|nr:hypothetical protein [Chloroflexota bacterium]